MTEKVGGAEEEEEAAAEEEAEEARTPTTATMNATNENVLIMPCLVFR